jgi:PAS domain S-box-containing protein
MTETGHPPERTPAASRPLDEPTVLRTFAERTREGLYVADAEGRLLDANPALVALLGLQGPAALVGRRLDEVSADPEARTRALAGLVDAGDAVELDVELVAADGTRRRAVETVALVRAADGTVRRHGLLFPLAAAPADEGGSLRDALTGCLDRTHLHALGERLQRDPTAQTGVIVVRLEHTREHDAATPAMRDDMRQRAARFLMRHVRGVEPVVRLDADDFLIVLAGARHEHTERVGRRVQLLALRDTPTALSIGWAAREQGESLPALVSRAITARVPVPRGGRPSGDERRRGEERAPGVAASDAAAPGRGRAAAIPV